MSHEETGGGDCSEVNIPMESWREDPDGFENTDATKPVARDPSFVPPSLFEHLTKTPEELFPVTTSRRPRHPHEGD